MLIVSNIVSLDGYVAGPDGNSTVLPMDGSFDAYNAERLRTADTLLVGANSYRMFAGFWPAVLADPDAVVDGIVAQLGDSVPREDIAARVIAAAPQEVARRNDKVAKVVVSDGVRAFDAPPPGLRLAETRRFDGSDNVLLRYEVRN